VNGQVGDLTQRGHHILLICAEADYARVVRPRLEIVEAVLDNVHIFGQGRGHPTGNPRLPLHSPEMGEHIRRHGASLLIVDPWVSSVGGALRLKGTSPVPLAAAAMPSTPREGPTGLRELATGPGRAGHVRRASGRAGTRACREGVPGLRPDQVFLVVGSDFEVFPSREYAEASKRDALALRVSGDFAVTVPIPTGGDPQAHRGLGAPGQDSSSMSAIVGVLGHADLPNRATVPGTDCHRSCGAAGQR
jgi:hypothetical protein